MASFTPVCGAFDEGHSDVTSGWQPTPVFSFARLREGQQFYLEAACTCAQARPCAASPFSPHALCVSHHPNRGAIRKGCHLLHRPQLTADPSHRQPRCTYMSNMAGSASVGKMADGRNQAHKVKLFTSRKINEIPLPGGN